MSAEFSEKGEGERDRDCDKTQGTATGAPIVFPPAVMNDPDLNRISISYSVERTRRSVEIITRMNF